MKLILVRHGESTANKDKIHQGWMPVSLSEKGKRQAKQTAQRLVKENIDRIYASDLKRVLESLEPLKIKAPISYHPELREAGKGELEGKPLDTLKPEAEAAGLSRAEYRPKGGESTKEMEARVSGFFDSIVEKHAHTEETICLYCHSGPINHISRKLLDWPRERWKEVHPMNGGFHIFNVTPEGAREIALNVKDHLEEEP